MELGERTAAEEYTETEEVECVVREEGGVGVANISWAMFTQKLLNMFATASGSSSILLFICSLRPVDIFLVFDLE